MTRLRVWISRTLDVVLRRRRDARLSEEIQEHLDLLTAEQMRLGLSADAARAAARRAFGGVEQIKEEYRDQRGLPHLETLMQDVRFAVRLLWRDPAFAAAAIGVLALGIGVNNMLFTIVNAHTLRGLPIRDSSRVAYLTTLDDRTPDLGVSYLDFTDWQRGARSFETLVAFTTDPIVLSGDDRAPDSLSGTFVSSSGFGMVGTRPMLGRDFTSADDTPGAPSVILLGSEIWEARYARDPGVLGRSVMLNGAPATIIGVMPERSGFPTSGQVWLPLSSVPGLHEQARDDHSLSVIGRLRNGTELAEARAEIETMTRQLAALHPSTSKPIRARVVAVNDRYQGSITDPAWITFMAVGMLVVLISCANAANLMLGRSLNRSREIAIRTALGASRLRVIRQLCIEGAVLAALGGACGLGLALGGVRLFRAGIPEGGLPYWVEYSADARVLAALVAVSAATVFLFALLPAIQGSRPDLNVVLKEGGRTAMGHKGRRWTTAFLAAEFGLAVVLLTQFVTNVRTSAPTLPSDAALRTKEILTAEIALPQPVYDSPERRATFYASLAERLGAVPSIASVSIASALPLLGGQQRRLDIMDRPVREKEQQPTAWTVMVGPRYFATLGLSLVRGRDFTSEDGSPGRPFAIVNERFVERFFPDDDPIGRQIAVTPSGGAGLPAWVTIAGISPSIRQRPTAVADPVVYLPLRSMPDANAALLVRSDMATDAVAALLRREMQGLDANLPLERMRTMAQVVRDAEWVGRISRNLARVLTLIAVMLATLGLYAVTSYAVSQRTQEIGVRLALGARRRHVIWFVARRVAFQLSVGLAVGIACTKLWGSVFSSGRAGVTVNDLQTLAGVAASLVVIAVIACFVPVRRATRLDPVAAIRHD